MKIAVIGSTHWGDPPDEFVDERTVQPGTYHPNHSVCSATVGIARAFRRAGFEVVMPGWNKVDDVDAAFICEHYMIQYAYKHGHWDFSKPTIFWGHINAVAARHEDAVMSGEQIMRACSGICFTRREALEGWRDRWGEHNYW